LPKEVNFYEAASPIFQLLLRIGVYRLLVLNQLHRVKLVCNSYLRLENYHHRLQEIRSNKFDLDRYFDH